MKEGNQWSYNLNSTTAKTKIQNGIQI